MERVAYQVALWLTSELDMPGRTAMPEIVTEVEAVSAWQAVVAVMQAQGIERVHWAAADRPGLAVRWYRLRVGPVCRCQGVSVRIRAGSQYWCGYVEGPVLVGGLGEREVVR